MRKVLSALAGAGLLATGPAFAADLPVKAPVYKAPPPAPVFSWTGFYIGGTVGGTTVSSKDAWTIDPTETADAPGAIAAREALSTQTLKASSVIGGPEVGYNWQYGIAVIGVEGDFNWASAQTTSHIATLAPAFGSPGDGNDLTESTKLNWLTTVRARAGVAWNQFLFYGTGGYAAGNVNLYDSSHYAAGVTETADVKKTLSGWAAGAGVEWAFAQHWTLKGEYLHVDLGTATTHSTLLPAFNVGYFHSHDITAEIGRVGVNYKF